jgi:hypothetical protein
MENNRNLIQDDQPNNFEIKSYYTIGIKPAEKARHISTFAT